MIAPWTGPHMRSQAIGGPAWRTGACPSPSASPRRRDVHEHRLGGEQALDGRARSPRRSAGRSGRPASSSRRASRSPSSRSPSAGGRQSSATTGAAVARERRANIVEADVHGPDAVGEEHRRRRLGHAVHRRPRSAASAADDRAASRAARALLGARMTPARGQLASWAAEALRVALGAAHRRDDRDPPAGGPAAVAGRVLDRRQRGRRPDRRGARSRARRRAGSPRRSDRRRSPRSCSLRRRRVDHRMRPTDRVLVVAEVDDLVGLGGLGPSSRPEDELGLAGQGSAAVQAAHAIRWVRPRSASSVAVGERSSSMPRPSDAADRPAEAPTPSRQRAAAASNVAAGMRAGLGDRRGIAAEEVDDDRLAGLRRRRPGPSARPTRPAASRSAR